MSHPSLRSGWGTRDFNSAQVEEQDFGAQGAEIHVFGIVIFGERKCVKCTEPSVIEMAAFFGWTNGDHADLWNRIQVIRFASGNSDAAGRKAAQPVSFQFASE